MTVYKYIDYLVEWLELQRTNLYAMDGYVLGISGGVDSAVCAHLLARVDVPVKLLMLPAAVNSGVDLDDGRAVVESAGLQGSVISISPIYDTFMEQIQMDLHPAPMRENVLHGNLMARLRMVILYTIAQSYRAIVVGTDNLAESYTGYFTKYGDGAADVLPLARLRKEQVFELAQTLGVPQQIVDKAPSAGLWQGQTDEDELGFSYTTLDKYLRGERIGAKEEDRIDFWHKRSHHKRMMPPRPEKTL